MSLLKLRNSIKLLRCQKLFNVNHQQAFGKCIRTSFRCSLTRHRNLSSVSVNAPFAYAFGSSDSHLEYKTVHQLLDEQVRKDPNKIAVISAHESIKKTFQEFADDVNNLSKSLRYKLNIKHGDVVALWSANCYNWLVIHYAVGKLGAILCTLNPVYKSSELEYSLKKCSAKLLFLPGQNSKQSSVNKFLDVFNECKDNDLPLEHLVLIDGEQLTNNIFPHSHLTNLIDAGKQLNEVDVNVESDDASIIMFTSGTTGKPKGAVLSHFNLVNNALLIASRFSLTNGNSIVCLPVPLFHVFGLVYGSVMMSNAGFTVVLPDYRYKLTQVVKCLSDYQCTHIMMVPAMTVDLANHAESGKQKISSSLRSVITGSAPTPVPVAKKFMKNVPSVSEFLIRYGSTETGGCMTLPLPGEQAEFTMANVGKPLNLTEVKLIDPKSGKIVKLNEQGEVWVRGHHVMLGYWKDEEKTKEAITASGFFKTGDMATMDETGTISLIGRTKEMIIRGGENIYPKEIEDFLHQHPSVLEAFVCGVPDERLGEEICAWIKLKDTVNKNDLCENEIKNFCKDKISYYKIPKYVLFVDEFPRTPTGKAQKFLMRKKSCEILHLKEN